MVTPIPTVSEAACAMLTVTKTADYGKQANAVCRVLILRLFSSITSATLIPTVLEAACATVIVTRIVRSGTEAPAA